MDNTIAITIIDDSPADREFVSECVKDWASAAERTVTIKYYSSAEEFILTQGESEERLDEPRVYLLDIEMGSMNGVELAKTIRRRNRMCQIVFITGYNDYIADGYEVEALNYLLKPVRQEKLYEVLDKAAAKLKINERCILIRQTDEIVRVPLYSIRYIEVRLNYITIHADEDYTVKSTLSAVSKELDEYFYRIGRSYIINLRFIRRVRKNEVLLSCGESIPLPRGAYDALNKVIIKIL